MLKHTSRPLLFHGLRAAGLTRVGEDCGKRAVRRKFQYALAEIFGGWNERYVGDFAVDATSRQK